MHQESPLLNVGEALRLFREEKGISQGEIMKATGLERSYISRIERGEIQYPRLSTIKKIAGAIGVSVDEFIHRAAHLVVDVKQAKKKRARAVTQQFIQDLKIMVGTLAFIFLDGKESI